MSKALAISTNTIAIFLCSFLAFLNNSCNNFRFSEHPAALMKRFCHGLIGHALVSCAVMILKNNLRTMKPMVIGLQLLIPFKRCGLLDFGIRTVQHSIIMSGIIPRTSQRLNISISWEYLGSILVGSLNVIPSGLGADFLDISLIFLAIYFSVIRAQKVLLSALLLAQSFPKPLNTPSVSHLDLKTESSSLYGISHFKASISSRMRRASFPVSM